MNKYNTEAPIRENPTDSTGLLSRAWQDFFSLVSETLFYAGSENSMTLVNNQVAAVDITNLSFDKRYVSAGHVDYFIQRTTSINESVETGTFFVAYKHKANTWQITGGPTTAGVTVSITADGQCQYVTTNQTGTFLNTSISRIVFRARSIRAKSTLYSVVGNAGAR